MFPSAVRYASTTKVSGRREESAEALLQQVLQARGPRALADFLDSRPFEESELISLLRLPVPAAFLTVLAERAPWNERPRLLAGVVLHPRCARPLGLRLVSSLYWRDLVDVAATPRVDAGIRARAEALLKDSLPDLRVGERITVARFATAPVLRGLFGDDDEKVLDAALQNPRLRESDLTTAVRADDARRPLLEAVGRGARWRESYPVRMALVLQPRTPLAIALAQLTSLLPQDLARLQAEPAVPALVKAAAVRVAQEGERR
jgi:hypothetical protein